MSFGKGLMGIYLLKNESVGYCYGILRFDNREFLITPLCQRKSMSHLTLYHAIPTFNDPKLDAF